MSDGTPIIIKKVKGHGGHAHHGGSWKVAYADFVTAMMAFFMVMWIMGLSDDTKAQIQGYFNDPLGFKKNVPHVKDVVVPKAAGTNRQMKFGETQGAPGKMGEGQQKEQRRLETIKKKIQAQIQSDFTLSKIMKGVEMTITQEGLRIELVESKDAAFFESGSAVLDPTAWRLLKKLGPLLHSSGRSLILEGHTDSVPYPSRSYNNWDLSSDRANALRRALFTCGVDDRQLAGVRALADTQLKFPTNPTDPRNRRVSILLPFRDQPAGATELPKDEVTDNVSDVKIAPETPDP